MQIDNSRKQQPSDLDELANDDWGNCTSTKPPYRSEMNLVLTFDGTSNTITSVTTAEDPPPPISDPNSSTPPPPPNTPSPNISHQDSPPPVIPAPMLLLPDTLPYVEFQDTRQTVPDPPSALPPTGASSQGRKSSNFATIRKRFFTRKSSVSNDSSDAKPVSEVNSSSSDAGVCILLSNGEVHEEVNRLTSKSRQYNQNYLLYVLERSIGSADHQQTNHQQGPFCSHIKQTKIPTRLNRFQQRELPKICQRIIRRTSRQYGELLRHRRILNEQNERNQQQKVRWRSQP